MRVKLRILLALCGLPMCGFVYAEGGCPAGYMPYNYGATVGCVPGGNDPPALNQTQLEANRPSGTWKKTWGAIASDGVKGVLGSAVGAMSESAASTAAIEDCKTKGGQKCALDLAFFNQCAAMVAGHDWYRIFSAATITQAGQDGMNDCRQKSTDCRIYYSVCSTPEFVAQ
jgi:hypothetical protein